jgi:hypothetical protein
MDAGPHVGVGEDPNDSAYGQDQNRKRASHDANICIRKGGRSGITEN